MEVFSQAIANLAAAVVTVLGGIAIQFLLKKLKAENNVVVRQIAQSAVLYVEEEAARRVKAGLAAWTGPTKLQQAVAIVLAKLPGITAAEAQQIVQAELAQVGLGASALAGAVAGAIRSPEPAPVPNP